MGTKKKLVNELYKAIYHFAMASGDLRQASLKKKHKRGYQLSEVIDKIFDHIK